MLVGVVCAAFAAAPALAQQEISGTVTDAQTGETLPGANVSVPGSTVGTATGPDGQYSLSVPADADSLRYSFVGYEQKMVAIAGRTTINVALRPSMQQMQEMVVVGYGEQEARDLTGSIEKVSSEDFNQAASISPEQAISGKIAGVQVSSSGGAPGSRSVIRIRGVTSVNANSQPLFVVDGVPLNNEPTTASRNPLNFLNPGDIANITVLKDASSTAIYGARGANGVVIIETKSGAEEGGRVTYNGSVSSSVVREKIDVLGADQFREVVQREAPENADRLGYTSTDWQDAIQRSAVGQQHSLSYSSGSEASNMRISLGYTDEQGIVETTSSERVSLSLKYNQDLLDDQLTVRTNLKGSNTKDEFAPGILGSAVSFDPTQPVRDVDSPYGGFYEWEENLPEDNPVASYVLTEESGETYRSVGNIEGEYRVPFLTGLSARVNLGYDVSTGERERFAPTNLKVEAEGDPDEAGTLERANFTRVNTLLDAYLNYTGEISSIDSEFDVTAGYSYQEFHEEYPEFTVNGLTTNLLGTNNASARLDSSVVNTTSTEIPSKLISGFGRVNYKLLDRYLLTLTVRRDGSSRFGPENRWGTFPSAALGWRIHQESFLEDYDWLSNLKLRLSWGINGNQEIGDFQYVSQYVFGGPRAQVQFGDDFVPILRAGPGNEDLKWEETTSYNAALDVGILDDRFTGSVEVYYKETEDMLFSVPAAGGANLSNVLLRNVGSMKNQGVEASLRGTVIEREDFSWNAQFNAATNSNELLNVDIVEEGIETGGISGAVGRNIQIITEGEPINSFFVFQHKLDENGDPIYEDVNGDGVIDDRDLYRDVNDDGVINGEDRVVEGNPRPDWILGHTSQFRFLGFDASFTLRAHLGQQVYNNIASNFGHYSRLGGTVPSNIHESALEFGFDEPLYASDVYIEDASFLRLDNITLGYSFGTFVPGVEQLRVYGSANNIFVLTGYSGPDPEVGGPGAGTGPDTGGGSPREVGLGIDNNIYPRSRTFKAGVNIQF
jgi:iron complex outermembrane receptor protein